MKFDCKWLNEDNLFLGWCEYCYHEHCHYSNTGGYLSKLNLYCPEIRIFVDQKVIFH